MKTLRRCRHRENAGGRLPADDFGRSWLAEVVVVRSVVVWSVVVCSVVRSVVVRSSSCVVMVVVVADRRWSSFIAILRCRSSSFVVVLRRRPSSPSFGVLRRPSASFGVFRCPSPSFAVLRRPSFSVVVRRLLSFVVALLLMFSVVVVYLCSYRHCFLAIGAPLMWLLSSFAWRSLNLFCVVVAFSAVDAGRSPRGTGGCNAHCTRCPQTSCSRSD